MRNSMIRQLPAMILACGLALSGCAGSGGQAPVQGQTAAGPETAAEPETAAADQDGTPAAEEAQDTESSAPGSIAPAGREGLLDFEEDGDASSTGDGSRELAPVNQIQKAENARITMTGEGLPAETADYTLMIYMVGSNLETEREAATNDLEEMLDSGIDFQKNNVIVYTGGARKWTANVPCDRNCLLDLSRGSDRWLAGMTDDSSDMGAPETLTEFLQAAAANYPADHYGLIFWDHGNGPISGFGVDELFGLDSLQFGELRNAMEASPFGTGGSLRLDWVGFDACLMGSLENAGLWKAYTDYLVASEELEPAGGWDYSFLRVLNTTADPVQITGAAVDSYYKWYTGKTNNKVTLAVYDLSGTDAVIEAYTDLVRRMHTDMQAGAYARIVQIRQEALVFGTSEASGRGSGTDLVDLDDMAACFAERYGPEAEAVRSAVSDMVLTNRTNMEGAAGLSVYFPGANQELYAQADSLSADSVFVSDAVKGFYDSYTDRWKQASAADWTLSDFRESEGEILLDLTPDQAANLAGASYTVLYPVGDGQYYIAMERVQADVDSSGVVRIPADPELIGMRDPDGTLSPLGFVQTGNQKGSQTYRSFEIFLSASDSGEDWVVSPSVDQEAAIIAALEDGQVTIQSVEAEDSVSAGKNTLDMRDYNRLIYDYGVACFPTRNEDGSMRSFEDWRGEGTIMGDKGWSLPEDRSIRLETGRVSDFYTEEPMILQVELSDVNGANHPSEIYTLPVHEPPAREDIFVKEDGQGTWTFTLLEDAAVLEKYEGDAEILTIPAEAGGLPVTEISGNAISLKVYGETKEVILPDSLRVLRRGAIHAPNMKSVSLPAGLEHVSSNAFPYCDSLKQILIEGDPNGQGKGIRTIDGVLFSADGTELLSYPQQHGTSYEVPEGTETIGYGAFAGDPYSFEQMLESVILPETVTTIEPLAFFGCFGLSEIRLPESLEYIGIRSFGTNQESRDELFSAGKNAPVESVYIGGNVEYIGRNAFDGLNLRGFTVSEQNRRYSAVGGMLAVKSGDTILEAPRGMDGLVNIPEGVVGIEPYLFDMFYYGTEFCMPDSLTRIPISAFPYDFVQNSRGDYEITYSVLFNCSEGSAAAQFADTHGIRRDQQQADDSQAADQQQTDESPTEDPQQTDESPAGDQQQAEESPEVDPQQADESAVRGTQYTTVTIATRYGQMDFQVYEDHAVLVACRGKDAILDIPAEAGGQPVTEIGDGFNSIEESRTWTGNENASWQDILQTGSSDGTKGEDAMDDPDTFVKKLQLPDTVKRINAKSLNCIYMRIDTLELPSALEYFDPEALGWEYRNAEIGAFRIEGNSTYKTIDGILYTADGKTLTAFPSAYKVENLPAAGTMENGDTVYTLEIPAGTEIIGPSAFGGYRPEGVTLQVLWPEGLQEIGSNAFFNAKLYDVRLPEGMETIGDDAFCLAMIRDADLILPDTITEISLSAFADVHRETDASGTTVYGFRSIHLPDDLKTMGNFVFSVLQENVTIMECDKISLGSKITLIGEGAFLGQNCKAYEVSPRNKNYSSANGFLLSADGKTLLTAPSGMTGEVTIPAGVTEIRQGAMRECPGITDVHISSEVTMIGADAFAKGRDNNGKDTWTVTIHCPAGSAAADYADLVGILWVEEE